MPSPPLQLRTLAPSTTTAKSEPQSSTERIRDEKDWTDGDFEIITSDCVRFRVPSFHLYSSR
jgi:hypothetical protein